MKGLSDTNVSHFSDPSRPRVIKVICGKGHARNDFGCAGEPPPSPPTPFHPAFVVFVVPGAVAHRAMGWGDGRIAQVVFFGR